MKLLPEFSAVIFDMDGLVLDTESTYVIAWQKASAIMGLDFSTDFCYSMSGLQSEDVKKKLLQHCGNDFDLSAFGALSKKHWHQYVNQHGILVNPGVSKFITLLQQHHIPYALATNSKLHNVTECLKYAQFENIFSTIITRDEVDKGKPAPDIFLLAAKKLDTAIEQCLVLEDSATGIKAALSSGAMSIFIPSYVADAKTTACSANLQLENMEQLVDIFQFQFVHPV